ncbi:MAG: hypothetical protein AB7L36_08575 [Sphingomonadaceae bacterium]
MAAVSINEVWDDTLRFFARERALLLPLGLATFGLAALIGGLVIPAPETPGTQPEAGPWMLALVPLMLLVLTGYLAVSRMVLRSHVSVSEALGDAVRLLPRAIGLVAAVVLVFVALSLIAGLIAGLIAVAGGLGAQGMLALGMAIIMPPVILVSIRLALLWPVLADREQPMRETFIEAVSLTRGNALKIAALLAVYFMLYVLIAAVLEAAVGSLLILLARSIGAPNLGATLISVLIAAFNAIYMSFWTVLLAQFYARLIAAPGRG